MSLYFISQGKTFKSWRLRNWLFHCDCVKVIIILIFWQIKSSRRLVLRRGHTSLFFEIVAWSMVQGQTNSWGTVRVPGARRCALYDLASNTKVRGTRKRSEISFFTYILKQVEGRSQWYSGAHAIFSPCLNSVQEGSQLNPAERSLGILLFYFMFYEFPTTRVLN